MLFGHGLGLAYSPLYKGKLPVTKGLNYDVCGRYFPVFVCGFASSYTRKSAFSTFCGITFSYEKKLHKYHFFSNFLLLYDSDGICMAMIKYNVCLLYAVHNQTHALFTDSSVSFSRRKKNIYGIS